MRLGPAHPRRVAAAAAAAGLTALFTSEPTARCRVVDGCLVIGRYVLRRGASADVAAALASGALAARLRQLWLWNFKKALKAVGGELYPALSRLVHGRARRESRRATRA